MNLLRVNHWVLDQIQIKLMFQKNGLRRSSKPRSSVKGDLIKKEKSPIKLISSRSDKVNKDYFSLAVEKSVRKSKKKGKASKTARLKCYTSCESINRLESIAKHQNSQILQLLKWKEELIRENERLKYYTMNPEKSSRQAYFLEEIQKKNLDIMYVETKIEESQKQISKRLKQLSLKAKSLKDTGHTQR